MTNFLELSLPDFNPNSNVLNATPSEMVCICCASQNNRLVNLTNCSHCEFLRGYYEVDFMHFVCTSCHTFLVKIEAFKKQVLETANILRRQLPMHAQKSTLQQSKTTLTSLTDESEGEIQQIKYETANQSAAFEITTDVKIEHESSDFENDLPLSQIKKKKQRGRLKVASLDEKYEGKIKVVTLTREELMAEREIESKKESYLKLPFKCESCIKGFDYENTLKSHVEKLHNKKGGFPCEICKSVLGSESSYKEHSKRHLRRFECVMCGKRTNDVYSVSQHYNRDHAPSDAIHMHFACRLCDYTTQSHRSYRYHREKHKQKRRCNICGNTFVGATGLNTHMYTVHGHSSRQYKCDVCGKSYRCKSGLLSHTARHAPRAAYCAPCGLHFATQNTLAHHLKTHSAHVTDQLKKFVCNDCDAKFLTKMALQTHIDWDHLKTIKHECTQCVKVFKTAVTLKKHINFVHEKKRPPRDKICDYCGRTFTTLSILSSHIRTHTGERPLRCEHCPATFRQHAARHTHRKLLHH